MSWSHRRLRQIVGPAKNEEPPESDATRLKLEKDEAFTDNFRAQFTNTVATRSHFAGWVIKTYPMDGLSALTPVPTVDGFFILRSSTQLAVATWDVNGSVHSANGKWTAAIKKQPPSAKLDFC